LIDRHSTQNQELKLIASRLAACLLLVASCTFSSWQKVQAFGPDPNSEYDVNGTINPYGSGSPGYEGMGPGSDVRLSDSNPTGSGGDRSMETELSPDYTQNQRTSRSNVPLAGRPTTTRYLGQSGQGVAQMDKVYGGGLDKLPMTRLDSFVAQAGGMAEAIYGDEGVYDIPPYFGFTDDHHINTGINSGGLTTGHKDGSLPEAWGYPQ